MVILKNISAHINVIIIMAIYVFAFHPQTLIAQSKKAFLVGISNYESSDSKDAWPAIHGSNDVELISATLKHQGFKTKILLEKQATAICTSLVMDNPLKTMLLLTKKMAGMNLWYLMMQR